MKIFRQILTGLVIILGLLGGGGYYYIQQNTCEPSPEAQKVVKKGRSKEDYLFSEGEKKSQVKSLLLIFHPGTLVDPESYGIWTQDSAKNGYSAAIVKVPLNLAVVGGNRADKIKENFPDSNYVIGGHSLDGVMASRYANRNHSDSRLEGVFFMASYPDRKGALKESTVPILSTTTTKDKILNQKVYGKAKQCLPERTEYVSVNSGDRRGFGSYGEQKGDGEIGISDADQQTVVVNTLESWLKRLE